VVTAEDYPVITFFKFKIRDQQPENQQHKGSIRVVNGCVEISSVLDFFLPGWPWSCGGTFLSGKKVQVTLVA
jgi:hypothetical protein